MWTIYLQIDYSKNTLTRALIVTRNAIVAIDVDDETGQKYYCLEMKQYRGIRGLLHILL